jgi:ligand-binding SRPBCC domain-containing protein
MRVSTFRTEVWLPQPLESVFPFFADARNLERITPPWLHFHILSAIPDPIQVGTRIRYQLRLHGVPFSWESEITRWQPPFEFVDVQRRGPYRLWHHRHRFEPCDGGTLVRDEVHYAVPGGWTSTAFLSVEKSRRSSGFDGRRSNTSLRERDGVSEKQWVSP